MNAPHTFPQPPLAEPPARGLAALNEVILGAQLDEVLDRVCATAAGPAHWRLRKAAELRDLFAMAAISGRLQVDWFDASADLRVVVTLQTAVPLRGPQPNAPLRIGRFARLGLTYRQAAMSTPQPGYSFVQILAPRGVWHPNCSGDSAQVVCLGTLPVNTPLREILLITFGALTLANIQFSTSDPAGVLNPVAADWWQRNADRMPLSREPFIRVSSSKP